MRFNIKLSKNIQEWPVYLAVIHKTKFAKKINEEIYDISIIKFIKNQFFSEKGFLKKFCYRWLSKAWYFWDFILCNIKLGGDKDFFLP